MRYAIADLMTAKRIDGEAKLGTCPKGVGTERSEASARK